MLNTNMLNMVHFNKKIRGRKKSYLFFNTKFLARVGQEGEKSWKKLDLMTKQKLQ